MYFKPVTHERVIDPYDDKMWKTYFTFHMYSNNDNIIMRSINYSAGSARDRAMKRLASRLGIEVKK